MNKYEVERVTDKELNFGYADAEEDLSKKHDLSPLKSNSDSKRRKWTESAEWQYEESQDAWNDDDDAELQRVLLESMFTATNKTDSSDTDFVLVSAQKLARNPFKQTQTQTQTLGGPSTKQTQGQTRTPALARGKPLDKPSYAQALQVSAPTFVLSNSAHILRGNAPAFLPGGIPPGSIDQPPATTSDSRADVTERAPHNARAGTSPESTDEGGRGVQGDRNISKAGAAALARFQADKTSAPVCVSGALSMPTLRAALVEDARVELDSEVSGRASDAA